MKIHVEKTNIILQRTTETQMNGRVVIRSQGMEIWLGQEAEDTSRI